ncbi:MAG: alpha/beta hydrolase [Sphaerochaetaceae bacterium]|jgi:carboxylesterase|nr:alpha/beta fold hydrolase [Sphaerochaetaceae bacterium]HHU88800.1 alpha/beta fold hydrolase [Spirochaetales bacterium]
MEIEIRRCAQPIELIEEPPSKRAIVALHGYTGYPGELALPAQELYKVGYDVFVPRYPGHGTSSEDFLNSRRADWVGEGEKTLIKALENYEEVSLIGHSMGGAIALILAARHSVKRLVLYAPALMLPSIPRHLLQIVAPFVKRKKIEWSRDERYPFFDQRDEGDDAYLGSQYWSYIYPRQTLELVKIMDAARGALKKVNSDILVITGGEDVTVPQDVGPLVMEEGRGENRWLHLPLATHLIPYDWDEKSRLEAMEQTVAWLSP